MPMYSGCGPVGDWTSTDARANYWVFATATGIWNTASRFGWLTLCLGLSPGCSKRIQALSVVLGTLQLVPVFVILKYLGWESVAHGLGTIWFGYFSWSTQWLVYSFGAWRNRSLKRVGPSGFGPANAVRLLQNAAIRHEDKEWMERQRSPPPSVAGASVELYSTSFQDLDSGTPLGTSRHSAGQSDVNRPEGEEEVILFCSVTQQVLANGLFLVTGSAVYFIIGVMFVTEVINVALMDLWFKMRLGPVGCVVRFAGLLKSDLFHLFLTCFLSSTGTSIYAVLVSNEYCSTLDPWEVRSLKWLDAGQRHPLYCTLIVGSDR